MGLTSVEDTIKALQKEHKDAHFMLVEGMSKLRTHKVKSFQSSVFHVSGHNWKLIVHTAGNDGTSDHLSFLLRIKDKKSLPLNWEVKCLVKLFIVPHTGPVMLKERTWKTVYFSADKAIFGGAIAQKHLMEKHLINDKLVFGAEVTDVKSNCAVSAIPRTIGTAERLKLTEVPRNNSRFTWKITQYSSFDGERHFSYEFTVGPRRWKLRINPKGASVGKGNSLALSLHATDFITDKDRPKAKTLVVYKLRVLDQLHRNHKELGRSCLFNYDLDHTNSYWGWSNFLPLEELNDPSRGYLVNDQIYLGVEFSLVSTTEYL